MDHMKVLKRAFEITWRYRALWIFGIILALTTASGGTPSGGGGGNGGTGEFTPRGEFSWPPDEFTWPPGEFTWPEIPPEVAGAMTAVGIGLAGLACVIVILIIVGTVARYVAETALIRMVDDHEETGEQHSVREGFRLGWSRTAFRLFLINLLIGLPVFVAFILMLALAAAPLLLWFTERVPIGVIGTVASSGLCLLTIFLAIVVGAAINLLKRFFWRACALEGLGVIDSIHEGFSIVRRHLKDVVIMWLIMVGIRIGWTIAMIASTIVLFPVILLLIIVGGLLGGIPALLVWGLTNMLFGEPWSFILAGLIGLPIFILVMAAPWVFLGGLMEVFKSSTWTLTYRELQALEGLETEMEIEMEMETGIEPEIEATEVEEWSELDEPGLDSLADDS